MGGIGMNRNTTPTSITMVESFMFSSTHQRWKNLFAERGETFRSVL